MPNARMTVRRARLAISSLRSESVLSVLPAVCVSLVVVVAVVVAALSGVRRDISVFGPDLHFRQLTDAIDTDRPLAPSPDQPLPPLPPKTEQTIDAWREALAAREEARLGRDKAVALRRDQVDVRVLAAR